MKVVYITGSTGRLGAVLGNGFLKAGYQVVGMDLNATSPSEWPLVEADVTSEKSVISAFEKAVSMVGAPDVVIHTVGMWSMAPI
ncbi:NAD-dependent epimerase/dehydratase family protein, partial [bacterium]|nr:NAD-dependent epimerase/dehydratase family protein [bacterium]